jgi:hypothetical protein
MLPSLSEIVKALYGTFLMARRHPDAPAMFDRSVDGFWRSLFAAVVALPANMLITARTVLNEPDVVYGVHDGVRDVMIYAIIWLAFPVIMIYVATALGRRDKLLDYLVPYNWASVPVGYLFAAVSLIGFTGVLTPGVEAITFVIVYGAAVLFFQEIARRQLAITGAMAIGIVVFDFLFSIVVMTMLESFAG